MKKTILVLLCISSINSFAFPHGSDLYPSCYRLEDQLKHINTQNKSLEFTKRATYCFTAATTAFDDITTIGYSWSMNEKIAACIDKYYAFGEFTASQVLDMTVKYLRDHPESRNYRIGTVMALMLKDNYPVPKSCKNLK